jgi:hypothetical protein
MAKSFNEIETNAIAIAHTNLIKPLKVAHRVLQLATMLQANDIPEEKLPIIKFVRVLLLQRIQNDLRCCVILVERGYPLQAAALDTVESGQPFLLPRTPGCWHEMPAQVAVRSMRQRKVGLLGKTAKHQGKSAEGEAPLAAPPASANRAQMCRRRTGSVRNNATVRFGAQFRSKPGARSTNAWLTA